MSSRLSRAFFLQHLAARLIATVPWSVDHNLGKYQALKKALYLTALDGVAGDYLEFGVFTGSSLSAAIELSRKSPVPRQRSLRYFGFDSFRGFGELDATEQHPFFKDEQFDVDVNSVSRRLLKVVRDPERLRLVDGFYEDTLKGRQPESYGIDKAAVVLIDCDTLSASRLVLEFIASSLHEGTILLIDDFYAYKGSPNLGTYGAFLDFEERHPEFAFRRVFDYGYGGAAYIVSAPRDA